MWCQDICEEQRGGRGDRLVVSLLCLAEREREKVVNTGIKKVEVVAE